MNANGEAAVTPVTARFRVPPSSPAMPSSVRVTDPSIVRIPPDVSSGLSKRSAGEESQKCKTYEELKATQVHRGWRLSTILDDSLEAAMTKMAFRQVC